MRHQDYDRVLLACAALICAALTVVAGVFETTTPAPAKTVAQTQVRIEQAPVRVEQLAPVRVVGTPFVLNTDPSVRKKD
jgi:hypothetical protein